MKTIYLYIGLYILLPFSLKGATTHPSYWKEVLPAFDTLTVSLEQNLDNADKDKYIHVIRKMYQLAEHHKDLGILQARAMYWDARINTNTDSAMCLLKKAAALVDDKRYEYDKFRIQHQQTKLLIYKGDWLPAYIQAKKEEAYFKKIADTLMLAHAWVDLGVVMSNLNDLDKALEYLEKADSCFETLKQTDLQMKNRLNICNILCCMERKEEAVNTLKLLLKEPEAQRDTSFYINVLMSLGFYDTNTKDAQYYTNRAYKLALTFGSKLLLAQTSINKATSLYNQSKTDSAQLLYRHVWNFSKGTDNCEVQLHALAGLTNTFAGVQRWDSAYHYSSLYQYYNDSLSGINNLSEITRIEGRAAIEKYENDLIQMEVKAKLQRKAHIWILTATGCFSLLVCGIFWYMRKKEVMKKQLKEIEVKDLNVSLENEKLKNDRYHLEIDSKNRELTSNIMLMQEKNQVLRNLLQQIDALGSDGELPRQKSTELKKQIKSHLQIDDEWQYFKLHFESVYPEFFVNLKKQYPSLTENDLRLCAYIRIGMSNKQIAQMLSVLPDSIKISRYRIRKKFLLPQKDSLEDFLRLT